MKCPLCNTEAKIQKSINVLKGGNLFRRLTFVCRNTSCKQFDKVIDTIELEQPMVVEEETPEPEPIEEVETVEEAETEEPILEGETDEERN